MEPADHSLIEWRLSQLERANEKRDAEWAAFIAGRKSERQWLIASVIFPLVSIAISVWAILY